MTLIYSDKLIVVSKISLRNFLLVGLLRGYIPITYHFQYLSGIDAYLLTQ